MKKSICIIFLTLSLISCTEKKTGQKPAEAQSRYDSQKNGEMVLVEGGSFIMGQEKDEFDNPPHEVYVDSFYISNTEVTKLLYKETMGLDDIIERGEETWAKTEITWYDAVEFCNKLSERDGYKPCYKINGEDVMCDFTADGYRLPTEAEWEFAARGGNKSKNYEYSGSNKAGEVAMSLIRGNGPVGYFAPNELGLYDMSGGVSEWCWDNYDDCYYKNSPKENPRGADKFHYSFYLSEITTGRVLRGADYLVWTDYLYKDVPNFKNVHRTWLSPDCICDGCGLRVARNAEKNENANEKTVLVSPIKSAKRATTTDLRQINMILVDGGTFKMGTNETWQNGQHEHEVSVDSFYISDIETPQHLFLEIMNYRTYTADEQKGDNYPAWIVSWIEAVEFCNKLSERDGYKPCYKINGADVSCDFSADGYRLPTEAEWEFAARGGNKSQNYEYSGSNNFDEVGLTCETMESCWYTVATNAEKLPNELGLYAMSGGVAEWCWDLFDFDYFKKSPKKNPKGAKKDFEGKTNQRVLRGGNWGSASVDCDVFARKWNQFNGHVFLQGFRICRSVRD